MQGRKGNDGMEKENGTVKWFNRAKGYGFIVSDLDSVEVFVHYSDIMDGVRYQKNLEDGERVRFRRVSSDRGPKAVAVVKVKS